jgi:hypothetical protein
VAQLSYNYAESEVELVPVAGEVPRGTYALCQDHVDRLRLPKGWHLTGTAPARPAPPARPGLDELAQEIRRVGLGIAPSAGLPEGTELSLTGRANLVMLTTRAHLRVVADAARYAQ